MLKKREIKKKTKYIIFQNKVKNIVIKEYYNYINYNNFSCLIIV